MLWYPLPPLLCCFVRQGSIVILSIFKEVFCPIPTSWKQFPSAVKAWGLVCFQYMIPFSYAKVTMFGSRFSLTLAEALSLHLKWPPFKHCLLTSVLALFCHQEWKKMSTRIPQKVHKNSCRLKMIFRCPLEFTNNVHKNSCYENVH